jgi:uncharacterized protein YgiM (DUF1202 family)
MENRDYTKFSENLDNNNVNPELEPTDLNEGGEVIHLDQENVVIEGVNELPEDAEVVDNVIPPIEDLVLKGVVNPGRLNVRKQPSKDSEVLEVITRNSEVEIGLDGETDEFYKVRTKSGVEGYCMKEFISIK